MRRPKPNESVMRFNASRTPSRRPWRLHWDSLYRRKARMKTQIWSRWVGRTLRNRFRIQQPTMIRKQSKWEGVLGIARLVVVLVLGTPGVTMRNLRPLG